MGKTHHQMPTILITDGLKVTEHKFTPTSNENPELVVESRVGLMGEVVRRSFTITPPLPDAIRRSTTQFLRRLIDSLKTLNYEHNLDLWVTAVEYNSGEPNQEIKHIDVALTDMEKMLHGLLDPKLIGFDVTPRSKDNNAIQL